MAYNGSGVYNLVMDWVADAAAGIKIRADRHMTQDTDFKNALSNVVCRDGQSTITADMPWNAKRITNLGDPVNAGDALNKQWAQANLVSGAYVADTPPAAAQAGNLWWDSDQGGLYLKYSDGTSTQWVQVNVGQQPIGIAPVVTVLTASGAYTKPAGLKALQVWAVGGGGGGTTCNGTGAGQSAASGGGGGGAVVMKVYAFAELAASESYTVGAGGGGGNPASAGGASTFSGLSAGGGAAGGTIIAAGTTLGYGAGGTGGYPSGGTLNIAGGWGGTGIRAAHGSAVSAIEGCGGSSFFAMTQMPRNTSGTALPKTDGKFPGGGGNGPAAGASQAAVGGGNGGDGCIILKEYF